MPEDFLADTLNRDLASAEPDALQWASPGSAARSSKSSNALLNRVTGKSHSRGPDPGAARQKVCLIDSEPELLQDLSRLLTTMGYEVLALNQVIGSSNLIRDFNPRLLVVDIMMPSVSGEKLIRLLRQNLKRLPSLILYADLDEKDLARIARSVAADDFVHKSGSYLKIINRIKYHLSRPCQV
jgi:CheY-like chemotaxis protein